MIKHEILPDNCPFSFCPYTFLYCLDEGKCPAGHEIKEFQKFDSDRKKNIDYNFSKEDYYA